MKHPIRGPIGLHQMPQTVASSRRFLICLAAGALLGIVLPALVFAIGWLIDRVRGDELGAEAFGLLLWTPLLGASMGIAFWTVRYPLAGRILGDVSDVYTRTQSHPPQHDLPQRKRLARWLSFWVLFGGVFGGLTVILFATVMGTVVLTIVATSATVESAASREILPAVQGMIQNMGPVLIDEAQRVSLSALAEPILFGAFVGSFFWILLLLILRRVPATR